MKFKFIGNAGGIFTGSDGTRILCDPWIVDGVFEDAWYHYPPLKTKLSDIKDVDGIFHEAALTIVQESFLMEEEYYDVNVKGTENIFKIAEKYGIKVVFASSSSVYGNTEKIPIIENNERNPINPYGKTKLEDEFLAEKYSKKGVSIIGLRYFNIFGKGQTGSYAVVITKFVNQLQIIIIHSSCT